jgi:hypothetical protein
MNDNLTAALIAAALLLTGTAAGIGLSSVADGATTVTVTATPPVVTVTAPPRVITRTVEVTRASRSQTRDPLTPWQRDYFERAQVWAASPKARAVIACESTNRPTAVSRTGKYRGLWQMDTDFWASYGGLAIAARPDLASRAGQNYVAYRGFISRGWTPWECA